MGSSWRRRSARALAAGAMAVAASAAGAAEARAAEDPFDVAVRQAQSFSIGRLNATTARLPTTAWPLQTSGSRWTTTGSGSWTSGFLPGSALVRLSGDGRRGAAHEGTELAGEIAGQAGNTGTHDLGFMLLDSFGHGFRLTGTDSYRQTVLRAAGSLSTRYSSTVGAIRSLELRPRRSSG